MYIKNRRSCGNYTEEGIYWASIVQRLLKIQTNKDLNNGVAELCVNQNHFKETLANLAYLQSTQYTPIRTILFKDIEIHSLIASARER